MPFVVPTSNVMSVFVLHLQSPVGVCCKNHLCRLGSSRANNSSNPILRHPLLIDLTPIILVKIAIFSIPNFTNTHNISFLAWTNTCTACKIEACSKMPFALSTNTIASLGRRHGSHAPTRRAHQTSLRGPVRTFLFGFVVALILMTSMRYQEQMSSLWKGPSLFDIRHDTTQLVSAEGETAEKNMAPLDVLKQQATLSKENQDDILKTQAPVMESQSNPNVVVLDGQEGLEAPQMTTQATVEQSTPEPSIQADDSQNKEEQEVSATKPEQKVTTVFSTSCSPFQDWQSQALVHNHRTMGIPGDLVRLMACDDPMYKIPRLNTTRYPHYRVVRMPDFNKHFVDQGHVDYAPRNRPASMEHWLDGKSEDGQEQIPKGQEHIVVAIDPDHLFMDRNTWHLDDVYEGHGVAALYAMGDFWMEEWGEKLCNPPTMCQNWREKKVNPSYGHPIIFTAQDALTHAKVWLNMTNDIKQLGHTAWESEMYTAVLAALYTNIQVKVKPFMVSNRQVDSEPWDRLQWGKDGDETSSLLIPDDEPDNQLPMLIGHYCQEYVVSSNYSFFKHHLRDLDIRKCRYGGGTGHLKKPSLEDQHRMEARRHKSLRKTQDMSPKDRTEIEEGRDVWMIDHVVEPIREALQVFHQDWCSEDRRRKRFRH